MSLHGKHLLLILLFIHSFLIYSGCSLANFVIVSMVLIGIILLQPTNIYSLHETYQEILIFNKLMIDQACRNIFFADKARS